MSEIFIADTAIAKRMTHLFGKARGFPDATLRKSPKLEDRGEGGKRENNESTFRFAEFSL